MLFPRNTHNSLMSLPQKSSIKYSSLSPNLKIPKMSRVRILNVFQIPLPTPPPRDTIPLSFLDTLWIGLPPVQLLLFYSNATIPFSSILESLKSSLSRTLPLFYPFAGKLTHIPSTGAISIDCSTDTTRGGVTFIEAKADGEIHRLGGGGEQDLLPVLDARELPAPVLAVQVTRLEGKGLALGLAAHHAVVDGKAVSKFLETWAAACRRVGDEPLACSVAAHDREVIRHPRGDEIARRFVQQLAPALPIVNAPIQGLEGRLSRLARRTFVISPPSIQALKDEAMRQRNDVGATMSQAPPPPPSTFVSVSAHAWIHFLIAKNVKPDNSQDTSLCFLVDCRRHLDPPPGEEYLGNCVVGCEARTKASEILSKGGFARACSAIQQAIEERVRDPLRGCENWAEEMMKARAMERMANIVASPRFKVYEVSDFGWGRPCKVELLPMNHEGEIVLFGAREEGGVQVSVALDPACMDAFASKFSQGFGA